METIHDANPLSFCRVARIFHAAPQIGELMPADQKMSGATPGRILSSGRYPPTLARVRFMAPQVKENSHAFQTDKWITQGHHRPFGFLQPLRSASSNQAKQTAAPILRGTLKRLLPNLDIKSWDRYKIGVRCDHQATGQTHRDCCDHHVNRLHGPSLLP